MNLFLFLLRLSPKATLISMIFGAMSGVANICLLAVISAALSGDKRFSPGALSWGFVAICLIMPLTRLVSETALNYLSQDAIFNMRMRLSNQILAAPLYQLEIVGSPRIYATLTEDVFNIIAALQTLPMLGINAAVVVSCFIYIGWLSLKILALAFGVVVLGVLIYSVLLKRGVFYQKLCRDLTDALFKHFRSLSEGTKELKLHYNRRKSFMAEHLRPTAASSRRFNVLMMINFTAAATSGQTLFFVMIGVMIFLVPRFTTLSTPVNTGSTLAMLYMMGPLSLILNLLPNLSRANISMKKVDSLGISLKKVKGNDELTAPPEAQRTWKSLELAAVTHEYAHGQEDERFTLGPIDLTFQRGELVFITGGNGSGKTTLIKLITALYLPDKGEIRLDGQPVTAETREDYRQLFSAIFSDFHLFEDMIGIEHPELDQQARFYLQQLHLDHKVTFKNGALSTTKLSHGQRKRLALLTAYLEDRPIYIFDEWAADQDPQFKEIFYYSLLPALKAQDKTVIVVTHDDHYYKVADRLVRLNYGKIENLNDADTLSSYGSNGHVISAK